MLRRLSVVSIALSAVASGLLAQSKATKSVDARSPAALERSIYAALEKNDYAAFNDAVGADFMYVEPNAGLMTWERSKSADILKDCKTGKMTLSDVKETSVTPDVVVLTYSVAGAQSCNGQRMPSPVYSMSVWHKVGGRWVAAAHSETPKAPAAAAAKK